MVLGAVEIKRILTSTSTITPIGAREAPFLQRLPSESLYEHIPRRAVAFWGTWGVGKEAVESATPTYARPSTGLDPPPGARGTRMRAQKLQPRATGTRLPAGPGHQAHPPRPDAAARFESPAPGTPPASARGTTSHAASSPAALDGPDPAGNLPTRSGPTQPGILLVQRGLPCISANARVQPGRGGGTARPRPIRPDAQHVPAHTTSSRRPQGKNRGWRQTPGSLPGRAKGKGGAWAGGAGGRDGTSAKVGAGLGKALS